MLDGEFLSRPYSIASAPGEALEFYLSTAGSSALTLALLRLQIGDRLHVARKPQGLFTLARVPSCRSLWMVATGTGLGPFIAMLRTEEPWQRAERIVLVHGAREVAHLSYAEELERISAAHEHRFTRVPILSRESAEGGILNGRVTSAIFDGTLEQRAGVPLAPEDSQVMLCGNPAMVEEMLRVLEQRGLRLHSPHGPGHVTIEK
jgi:ferredoxin--NADP+ reductase